MKELPELFNDWLPYCIFVALPVFMALSPDLVVVAGASPQDFPVHRLAQFEFAGSMRGSKAAAVSMDVRSAKGDPSNLLRKVVVTRLQDTTVAAFNDLVSNGAGAILLVMSSGNGTAADAQQVLQLEEHLLASEVEIPVYFAHENAQLAELLQDLDSEDAAGGSGKKASATQALYNAVASTGYQLVTQTSAVPKPLQDSVLKSIEGRLGENDDESRPTIAVVAHYDSLGAAPSLSYGADSNGSGVAVLLEVARLFSKLYASGRSRPNANLVFLLSAGGKLNYFGARKWLDEHLEDSSDVLANLKFAVCLDSLGAGAMGSRSGEEPPAGSSKYDLYMHVSKRPKEDSHAAQFYDSLKLVASKTGTGSGKVEMVHKKINLKETMLQWEHEPFSISRLPAFTLSSVAAHDSWDRAPSVLDRKVDSRVILRNARVIAEALACTIFGTGGAACGGQVFSQEDHEDVPSGQVEDSGTSRAWLEYLSDTPRFAGLMSGDKSPGGGKQKVVAALTEVLKNYAHSVRLVAHRRDKREPEFNFYDLHSTVMTVYKVKPAVFDLVLMTAIAGYLFLVYCAVSNSSALLVDFMCSTVTALLPHPHQANKEQQDLPTPKLNGHHHHHPVGSANGGPSDPVATAATASCIKAASNGAVHHRRQVLLAN